MPHIKQFLLVLLFLSSHSVLAGELVAEVGFHSGGDNLNTSTNTDGSIEALDAGDGMSIAAGYAFALGDTASLNITFGMKQDVIYPDNGRVSFIRYPVDLLALFSKGNLRYGIGVTRHFNPQYKEETDTDSTTVSFEDADGYLFDLRYVVFDNIFVSARYTVIEYKVENAPNNTTFDGSSIGLLVGIQL